jgi:hypothetical protein
MSRTSRCPVPRTRDAVGRPAKTKAALVVRAIQDGIVNAHDCSDGAGRVRAGAAHAN